MQNLRVKITGLEDMPGKEKLMIARTEGNKEQFVVGVRHLSKILIDYISRIDVEGDVLTVNFIDILKVLDEAGDSIELQSIAAGRSYRQVKSNLKDALWRIRALPNYLIYRSDNLNLTKLDVSLPGCAYGFTIQPDRLLDKGTSFLLDNRTHVVLKPLKLTTIEQYMADRTLSETIDVLRAMGSIITIESPIQLKATSKAEVVGEKEAEVDILHL